MEHAFGHAAVREFRREYREAVIPPQPRVAQRTLGQRHPREPLYAAGVTPLPGYNRYEVEGLVVSVHPGCAAARRPRAVEVQPLRGNDPLPAVNLIPHSKNRTRKPVVRLFQTDINPTARLKSL